MTITELLKQQCANGELSLEEALKQAFLLLDERDLFVDTIINKYNEQKMANLENMEYFKGHSEYDWYNSAFYHIILFLEDLREVKAKCAAENVK